MDYNTGNAVSQGFSMFDFVKKHWALLIFIILLSTIVVPCIRDGIVTHDYTKPAFKLAGSLLLADNQIADNINLYEKSPDLALGVSNSGGLFNSIKYYWALFWFVFNLINLTLFVFLPLILLYKITSLGNHDQIAKNWFMAFIIFLIYLLTANCIITTYSVASGSLTINLSGNMFKDYFTILMNVIPFHGLYTLGSYILRVVFVK